MLAIRQRLVFHGLRALIVVLILGPVVIGLLGTWLPAAGYFPAVGKAELSLQPWQALVAYPGFFPALVTSLKTGILSSVFALGLTLLLLMGSYPSALITRIERSLPALLSFPHVAFAVGLSFLLVPSGWFARLLNLLTPWVNEPFDWISFQDPAGLSLIIALTLKEVPFLLLMSLAVLPSLAVQKTLWLAQSNGHSRRFAWLWLVFPQLYRRIRLPFFAVLAYSLTVVDVALIAGPTTPTTLAVLVTRLFADPELSARTVGAAGATLLFALVLLSLALAKLAERPLTRVCNMALQYGRSDRQPWVWERAAAWLIALTLSLSYVLAFGTTLLWSLTQRWSFPQLIPESFSLRAWSRVLARIEPLFWHTLLLAALASLLALALVVLLLESRSWQQGQTHDWLQKFDWLLYTPLLVPQIAFLFGFQVALIQLRLDGLLVTVLWAHLLFVFPYLLLTLSGPYQRYDQRYSWLAQSLRQARLGAFWKIKLPILMRPILYALATGFAVSVAQYLPTLYLGAGKIATLTTETVAMYSGSDRRLMAVVTLWQQLLPLLMFAMAVLLPAWLFRNRRALQ